MAMKSLADVALAVGASLPDEALAGHMVRAVRPLRVGITQSNISTPRATAPTRSAGVPTPIR